MSTLVQDAATASLIDVLRYSLPEVARYLGVPVARLAQFGDFDPADSETSQVSFRRLADLFVQTGSVPWFNIPKLEPAEVTALYAGRVELQGGHPVRLFPFSRNPSLDAPKVVVIDPRIRFGHPSVVNQGVPTAALIDRFRGGDTIADLMNDYGLSAAEVEEAVRYESRLAPAIDPDA